MVVLFQKSNVAKLEKELQGIKSQLMSAQNKLSAMSGSHEAEVQVIIFTTPGRQQTKTLSTIDERGSKIDRNSVFDCHLSPVWRQVAIKNSVAIFYLRSLIVLVLLIAAYPVCSHCLINAGIL